MSVEKLAQARPQEPLADQKQEREQPMQDQLSTIQEKLAVNEEDIQHLEAEIAWLGGKQKKMDKTLRESDPTLHQTSATLQASVQRLGQEMISSLENYRPTIIQDPLNFIRQRIFGHKEIIPADIEDRAAYAKQRLQQLNRLAFHGLTSGYQQATDTLARRELAERNALQRLQLQERVLTAKRAELAAERQRLIDEEQRVNGNFQQLRNSMNPFLKQRDSGEALRKDVWSDIKQAIVSYQKDGLRRGPGWENLKKLAFDYDQRGDEALAGLPPAELRQVSHILEVVLMEAGQWPDDRHDLVPGLRRLFHRYASGNKRPEDHARIRSLALAYNKEGSRAFPSLTEDQIAELVPTLNQFLQAMGITSKNKRKQDAAQQKVEPPAIIDSYSTRKRTKPADVDEAAS